MDNKKLWKKKREEYYEQKEKLLECLRNTYCSGDNKEKAKRYEVYKEKLQELLRYV